MSQKEVKRGQILDLLEDDKIGQKEAAKRMEVSPRQVRRRLKRYRAEGLSGLASKKRGGTSIGDWMKPCVPRSPASSAHTTGTSGRRWRAEKLACRHDIQLSVESTRQMTMRADYWQPKRGRNM